ncbi:MAG: GTPase domain-containing protein [Phycisphaerae bacterium]
MASDSTDAIAAPGASSPVGVLSTFISRRLVAMRRESEPEGGLHGGAQFDAARDALRLAEAALRYRRDSARRPPQIAVLGPTQTGKSTIVNLLVGAPVAGVSPLAGFTVHACGFAIDCNARDAWTASVFPGRARRWPLELSREKLDEYSLVESPASAAHGLAPCVIWDTPDFDSLAARSYAQAVLESVALADAHLLVLSKEKYADQSAWTLLKLLKPLGTPLVVCLNKLTPEARGPIMSALAERLSEFSHPRGAPPIVCVSLVPGLGDDPASSLGDSRESLQQAISLLLNRRDARSRDAGVAALLRANWTSWTAPIEAEHAAADAYQAAISEALAEAVTAYRRDFLDHPERYDTFRRATIELLHLLEIPGVSGALDSVRRVITWPARQLIATGKAWWRQRGDAGGARLSGEQTVLRDAAQRVLTGIQRHGARARGDGGPYWRALGERLLDAEPSLMSEFSRAAEEHERRFVQKSRQAARQLYDKLRESPTMLTALRTARVTADLGGIALAIKTGGAHLNDLLLAPAALALTSLLAEGALGTYMRRVADDFKREQFAQVRDMLMDGALGRPLRRLGESLQHPGIIGISRDELCAARAALDEWERSVQLGAVNA